MALSGTEVRLKVDDVLPSLRGNILVSHVSASTRRGDGLLPTHYQLQYHSKRLYAVSDCQLDISILL